MSGAEDLPERRSRSGPGPGADRAATVGAWAEMLEDAGPVSKGRGGEAFLYEVLVPLAGLLLALGAGLHVAVELPRTRLAVGLAAAVAATATLAVLTGTRSLPGPRHALHVGTALTLAALAGACGNAWLAWGTVTALLPLLAYLGARNRIAPGAFVPPALLTVPVWSLLHPDPQGILPAILALAGAVVLDRHGRPGVGAILLVPVLELLAMEPPQGVWAVIALGGLGTGASMALRRRIGEGTHLSGFALALLTSLFGTSALVHCGVPVAVALVVTACTVGLLAAFRGLRLRRPAPLQASAAAVLLAGAALIADGPSELGRAAALLGIGVALQLLAVPARNGFASRIALLLVFTGATGPLVTALWGSGIVAGDTLLAGVAATGALLLFARRVPWRGVAEPWWRTFATPRTAVRVRRLLRFARQGALRVPLIGPVMSAAGQGARTVRAFLRRDDPIGLPEALTVAAHLYVLTLVQAWIASLAPWAALSPGLERVLIGGAWCAAGLVVYAVGRARQSAFLRLAGLAYAAASPFTAGAPGLGPEGTALLLLAGLALAGIGTLTIATAGGVRRERDDPPG